MKYKYLFAILCCISVLYGVPIKAGNGCYQVQQLSHFQERNLLFKFKAGYPSLNRFCTFQNNDTISFEREISFGSTNDVLVGIIRGFAVDAWNRVFIADFSQSTIHVFDPDGSYLISLGRQGRGPEEFGSLTPNTSITTHSNRLYATDSATNSFFPHRVHIFSLEDLSFSHTVNLISGNREEFEELDIHYPKQIHPRQDGTLLVTYHRRSNEYRDSESVIHYMVQDSTGTIVSGPILFQKDRTNLTHDVTNAPIPYLAIYSFPFFGKSLLAVSDEDLIYAVNHTEEFKFDIYDATGDFIRAFQYPFNNVPLNRNSLMDRFRTDESAVRLGDGVALDMIREAENLPDAWPAIEEMLIDDENRLWVSTIVEDFDIYEWWVLEDTGELITKFEWPREEPIEVVRNGYMYTRETEEETGLQQIVRYRIEMEETE